MSLPTILRHIAQKSQHPNALLHKVQLAKAQKTHLPAHLKISDGTGDEVFSLSAPEKEPTSGEKTSSLNRLHEKEEMVVQFRDENGESVLKTVESGTDVNIKSRNESVIGRDSSGKEGFR